MQLQILLPLLLITILAVAVPFILGRFRGLRLPIVVGEILVGIVIGRSGFDVVPDSPTLHFLADFGFTFLMFLSGLEVDFSIFVQASRGGDSAKGLRNPLVRPLIIFGLTLAMALGAGFLLQRAGLVQNPILMGLILSTTSLGVVAPVLKERQIIHSEYGQSLLIAASIADFTTLLLLTITVAVDSNGISLDLLLIPLLLVFFAIAVRLSQFFARVRWLRRVIDELSHATAQIQVRGALALMVAWVVLSDVLGVEVVLGAFLAGSLISLMGSGGETGIREKLDAVGFGFFIPIFFIMVGVNFDLTEISGSGRALVLVPLLIGIAYLVKLLPSLLLRTRFSWRETLAGGFLLSSRLSLIIAAAAIALEIGAITAAIESTIILVAVVTCTLSPLAFNGLYHATHKEQRQGVILVGGGHITELLALRLHNVGQRLQVICSDPHLGSQLKRKGISVVPATSSCENDLRSAGADHARALIALDSRHESVLQTCRLGTGSFHIPLVIAQSSDTDNSEPLRSLGVQVVQPSIATAMAFEALLTFPTTFSALMDHGDEIYMREIILGDDGPVNKKLRDVRLPGDALILSIRREGGMIIPHGDTVLRVSDYVTLVGSPEIVDRAAYELGSGMD